MKKKKYKKNFLSNVIFKLDFPTLLDNYTERIGEFQKLIKSEFPILEEKIGVIIEQQFKRAEQIESKSKEALGYMFFNKTKKRIVSFEFNNIIVEFKEYTNFEDYLKIIDLVITSLFKRFPSIVSTRLGLRYINHINLDEEHPFIWIQLNKSLLDSMNFFSNKKDISRYITSVELNKEDYRLRFQYGIANSLYPNRIIKKEFILDYDCFTFESLEGKEEILNKVKGFNETISDMFEESIEDELRELMEVVEDE